MKKIVAIFLCIIITVTMTGYAMAANEETVSGGLYSAEEYGGFSLSWTNNGNNDILLSATDENGTIFFQYDENDYRTVKVNSAGEATYFMYDSYKLMAVQYGTHQLAYTYDAYGKLTGITIDGTSYSCELEDGSVRKLIDGDGNTAVEYIYDGSRVVAVYGRDEFGNLVDKTNDSEFIGNLNRVTYNSYYYDVETGWYYCGRYYDAENGRFVDGVNASVELVLQQIGNARAVNDLTRSAYQMYNQLINTSTFGTPKSSTSSDWYAGLSDVELLARLIYGENPYAGTPGEERRAVAWVLWNRKVKAGYGGDTLREVALNPGHFLSIGAGDISNNARNPVTASSEWNGAVVFACMIYCAETGGYSNPTEELEEAMPRPLGITENHTFFSSFHSSLEKLNAGKTLNSAVIAGYGSVGSSAAMLEMCYSEYLDAYYEETGVELEPGISYVGKVNIFYTNYPG